jgi:nucleoside-diphosphate-sugar epimerase
VTWAITGGSGFLGAHLAERLLERGVAVRTLDLEPLDPALVARGAQALVGDVRNLAAAETLCRGADVLVHAAALLPSGATRRELRSVNVEGTATVLAAAAAAGVRRVVFVSSAVVYGLQPGPHRETSPPAPIEAYGEAKLAAERICRDFGSRGLETVVLRPQACIGPGRLGLFGILFEWILEGRRIYTIGPGRNRYQLLAVGDLSTAIELAAELPVAGQTFNLGAERFDTVTEELRALVAHAASRSRVAALPAAPARALLRALSLARVSPLAPWHYLSADRDVVVDTARAAHALGWVPRSSNRDALAAAYDWYAANRLALGQSGTTHRTRWDEKALALVRRLS